MPRPVPASPQTAQGYLAQLVRGGIVDPTYGTAPPVVRRTATGGAADHAGARRTG